MTNHSPDRHAEAIAQVSEMRDTIVAQNNVIIGLHRELQTERDRVHLLIEERSRWRSEALACRVFVTKLATIQEMVNRATEGAKSILDDMAAMDSEETSKESITETTNTIEENLRKLREVENDAPVETMPEGAPSHS